MIRVNLVGRPASAKGKKGGLRLPDIPNVGILLFVLFLVMEGAVFYLWQMQVSDEATRLESRLKMRKTELTQLQKNKDEITKYEEEVKKLAAQKTVFEELFAEKVGPVNALQFLSFLLQPRDEATTPAEDLKAMEAAGWRVAWDARKAWFTSYRETNGEVTIQGRALGHDDVAEVLRRLESSPYFREPKLVYQENKKDDKLGVSFVEFSLRAALVYQIKPQQPAEAPKDEKAAEADKAAGASADATSTADGGADVALIAPKIQALADDATQTGASSADAADAVDAQPDAADAKPDAADTKSEDADDAKAEEVSKPADKKEKAGLEVGTPGAKVDDGKAPMPAATGAAEPPPAAAADKLPTAE